VNSELQLASSHKGKWQSVLIIGLSFMRY